MRATEATPAASLVTGNEQENRSVDVRRLFVWVLGREPDDDRVIPLLHGPPVHIIIGKALRD